MTGKKSKERFLFFKYVPPKKNSKSELKKELPENVPTEDVKDNQPLSENNLEGKLNTEEQENAEEQVSTDKEESEQEVDSEGTETILQDDSEPMQDTEAEMEQCDDLCEPDYPELPKEPEKPEEPKDEGPCPKGTIQHVIQPGDTFWKLAKKYKTSVEGIVAANPEIDPLNLQEGEIICIPEGVPGAKG